MEAAGEKKHDEMDVACASNRKKNFRGGGEVDAAKTSKEAAEPVSRRPG